LILDLGNKNNPESIANIVRKPKTGEKIGCRFIKKKFPV
jgi:hypothetical protein